MRSKLILIATISLCLLAAPFTLNTVMDVNVPTVSAKFDIFQDPDGFCDVHWGESLATIQASHRTELLGYYTGSAHHAIVIPDAKGCLYFSGPVAIRGIFRDDKLFGIQIPFSLEDFQTRYDALCRILGTPDESKSTGFYSWEGPETLVILMAAKNKGVILLAQKPTTSN